MSEKANVEFIKKLPKHFNVPSSQVNIGSGFISRRTMVEIIDLWKIISNLCY